MLPIALLIAIFGFAMLALVLIALGVRGRVSQRGQFCRRCRFDLVGIDLGASGARCTECGRTITDPAARRSTLRARRRGPIIVGAIILLLYVGIGAIVLSGSAPAVMAKMPNQVVLSSAQWGSDAALDELVLRLSRAPTLADAYWSQAIEHAMTLQADQSKAWDPRWGEVLAQAWVADRLSPEQIRAYVTNGQQVEVYIRDRMHADMKFIGVSTTFTFDRITAVNPVQTGLNIERAMSSSGINGVIVRGTGAMMRSQFNIPSSGFGGSTGVTNSIPISVNVSDWLSPGDQIRVFIEFSYTLKDEAGDLVTHAGPIRFEQTVTILEPDEPIVRVIEDPAAAKQIIGGCEIDPIVALNPEARSMSQKNTHGEFTIYFTAPSKAIAGTLNLRTEDGEEVEANPLSLAAATSTMGIGGMTIFAREDEPERLRIIEQIVAAGHVDVVFRTDPTKAENNPKIDEVVNLEMIFRDVPVLSFDTQVEMDQTRYSQPRVAAEIE